VVYCRQLHSCPVMSERCVASRHQNARSLCAVEVDRKTRDFCGLCRSFLLRWFLAASIIYLYSFLIILSGYRRILFYYCTVIDCFSNKWSMCVSLRFESTLVAESFVSNCFVYDANNVCFLPLPKVWQCTLTKPTRLLLACFMWFL